MAVQEKVLWTNWASSLREQMMTGKIPKVAKLVADISEETQTTKSPKVLSSARFWKDCQMGKGPQGSLLSAGFEVDFKVEEDNSIKQVTLQLNNTWMTILQRVLDRQAGK
jgi:hypothetical protein